MKIEYETQVTPYLSNGVEISFTGEEIDRLEELTKRITGMKSKEEHHKVDNHKEEKRFLTGLLGEMAVEKLFGIPVIEWSVGYSARYNHPDIPGYSVGIKTVEDGKFPIIPKRNTYPQIICVYNPTKQTVTICGFATVITLNRYQSDDLILSPALRSRNVKTGFYGFHMLIPLKGVGINILKGNKVNT